MYLDVHDVAAQSLIKCSPNLIVQALGGSFIERREVEIDVSRLPELP